MACFRSGAGLGVACLLVLSTGLGSTAEAQGVSAPPLTSKSVHGTLETVDAKLSGIIMKSDDGKRLAWRFDKRVIAQLSGFKAGDPVVVIYRQQGSDKTVTAVAFPGATATPIYINTTGDRVEFVSGPAVNGACGHAGDAATNASTMPVGGKAEVSDACWCCAPAGETCTPANKTGLGEAFLVRCYK